MLGVIYTDLLKQPYDWVQKMVLFKVQKAKAEEWEIKKNQSNQKTTV
jgi:hypothetical protein